MKPNQKNRYNGRYNNRNNRSMILRNTALESSGPSGKLHGTALQLFEKYQAAAKDALIQNDLVLAQTFLQYADHYIRLQNIAIANEQAMRASCYTNNNNLTSQSEETEETIEQTEQIVSDESTGEKTEQEECLPVETKEQSEETSSETVKTTVTDAATEKPVADTPDKTVRRPVLTRKMHSAKTKEVSDTATPEKKDVTSGPVVEKVIRRGRPRMKSKTVTSTETTTD